MPDEPEKKYHYAKLKKPKEYEVFFPKQMSDIIFFDENGDYIVFMGVMSGEEKIFLLDISTDKNYQDAITSLFNNSQEKKMVCENIITASTDGGILNKTILRATYFVNPAWGSYVSIMSIKIICSIFIALFFAQMAFLLLKKCGIELLDLNEIFHTLSRKDSSGKQDTDDQDKKSGIVQYAQLIASAVLATGAVTTVVAPQINQAINPTFIYSDNRDIGESLKQAITPIADAAKSSADSAKESAGSAKSSAEANEKVASSTKEATSALNAAVKSASNGLHPLDWSVFKPELV